jgi:hypothetical protein
MPSLSDCSGLSSRFCHGSLNDDAAFFGALLLLSFSAAAAAAAPPAPAPAPPAPAADEWPRASVLTLAADVTTPGAPPRIVAASLPFETRRGPPVVIVGLMLGFSVCTPPAPATPAAAPACAGAEPWIDSLKHGLFSRRRSVRNCSVDRSGATEMRLLASASICSLTHCAISGATVCTSLSLSHSFSRFLSAPISRGTSVTRFFVIERRSRFTSRAIARGISRIWLWSTQMRLIDVIVSSVGGKMSSLLCSTQISCRFMRAMHAGKPLRASIALFDTLSFSSCDSRSMSAGSAVRLFAWIHSVLSARSDSTSRGSSVKLLFDRYSCCSRCRSLTSVGSDARFIEKSSSVVLFGFTRHVSTFSSASLFSYATGTAAAPPATAAAVAAPAPAGAWAGSMLAKSAAAETRPCVAY